MPIDLEMNGVTNVKKYCVFLFQLIIWSSYTLAEWLSMNDRFFYKSLMFLLFSYFAIYIGKLILQSTKQTLLVTVMSLFCYAVLQICLEVIIPIH
ncbi:hypothetical protein BAOM_1497 [Peribacillus asahii]|uniref:Uncharacterized protein n=2 Tax=Peribacillus asahii TaxID=228899 RepID=A0A3T0KP19_9BACI|nr:hypothetical protein BAOM_1497 [Peribacillus asahii]